MRASARWLVCLLCGLSFALGASAQLNTDRVMAIGRNALYFEDYILSIQYFNRVIGVKPYMAEPYVYRAIAKLSLEDFQGAEEDCSEALERNPFIVRAYYARSYARIQLKDYEGSIADCTRGLEFDTENKSLMLNRAASRMYAGQYDSARIDLDDLISRYPRFMYAYMSRGQLNIEAGDTLAASDDFSRAISVDRFYAPAYAARAYVSLLRENYKDAIPDFNEAIRLEPNNEGYYINRGLARYYSQDYRGVLSDFERVLQLNPNSTQTYYNRGLIRAEVGEYNRALDDFDKVLELEPDNDMALYNRALLRSDLGDLKGAEADLTAILTEYPNFIPAYYQRSEIRRKLGNAKGADKDYFAAWDLENQLEADRAAGRKFSARGSQPQGKTRTEDDKDLNKYNRVVVSETDMEQTMRYANPIRGNVQNFNVDVAIEPMFALTFYEQRGPVDRVRAMDWQAYVDSVTVPGVDWTGLRITNQEKALDDSEVRKHFGSIDHYSKLLVERPDAPEIYLARALDFSLVKDEENAINDLGAALAMRDNIVLAYFLRANLRFRRLIFENSSEAAEMAVSGKETASSSEAVLNSFSISDGTFGAEYMLVMQDYDRLLQLAPEFVYAWYNRGNIRCQQRDYRSALEDYDKAIALRPEFAEAWYNRGITRLYLGEREQALRDLSRAGELGLFKAYNIIKRFSE